MSTPALELGKDKPFVDLPPAAANALSLFAGEWASRLPAAFAHVPGQGTAGLFEDERIDWAAGILAAHDWELEGKSVLELGPLEGGHTFMLHQRGVREVTAIEANARAYLKCLAVKEAMGLTRARFLLGNALSYLRSDSTPFDVGLVCAFLNHMTQPVEVIELMARRCRALFVWNVVFSDALFEKQPEMRHHFGPPVAAEWAEFRHTLFPHTYDRVESYRTFWGGMTPNCCWMSSADVVAALRHFGFKHVEARVEPSMFGEAVGVVALK